MTVRIEDLKVGMKVKLVDSDKILSCKLFNDMTEYLGEVYTVSAIYPSIERIRFEEDRGNWSWDITIIEKIVDDKEKRNKVYTRLRTMEKENPLKDWEGFNEHYQWKVHADYKFKKCIVNDNCVIAIFELYGRAYKGIAKCHPDDEFDLAKGLTIAMLRAYKDCLDRQIKKLY